jgi:chloramphenicol O-acetyltransferase type A
MYKKIDIDLWKRKAHFIFFKNYKEPFLGITVDVDVTNAYQIAKSREFSFFLYYLHKAITAANILESFRYRIKDGEVLLYDVINASATINRENGTFGFSYIAYHQAITKFIAAADIEILRVRNTDQLLPLISGDDVIHFSSLPWIKFTALSHARNLDIQDSCPKISFGKMTDNKGKKSMPVSIHVHHALMDGSDVGKFIECFQNLLDEKEIDL